MATPCVTPKSLPTRSLKRSCPRKGAIKKEAGATIL